MVTIVLLKMTIACRGIRYNIFLENTVFVRTKQLQERV